MTRMGSVGEEVKKKSAGYVDRRGWDSTARPLLELDNIFWCMEDDDFGAVTIVGADSFAEAATDVGKQQKLNEHQMANEALLQIRIVRSKIQAVAGQKKSNDF